MSILNGFSEVYERFENDSMPPIIQTFLSTFAPAYRKHYSANLVLINLIENWKKNLDNNKIVVVGHTIMLSWKMPSKNVVLLIML